MYGRPFAFARRHVSLGVEIRLCRCTAGSVYECAGSPADPERQARMTETATAGVSGGPGRRRCGRGCCANRVWGDVVEALSD